ncbi:hypothetical protein EPO33_04915 [Patescibacteria group bacterium]|nr:MAG: hypothetical protein EPO33_04915 [Patescibacteria group bacterium]
MTYLVSYDLRKVGKDYSTLHAALRQFAYARPLESVWLVKTSLSGDELRTHLLGSGGLDANDRLLITRMTTSWWSENLDDVVLRWMHNNVS